MLERSCLPVVVEEEGGPTFTVGEAEQPVRPDADVGPWL